MHPFYHFRDGSWGFSVQPDERREARGMALAADGELVHRTVDIAVPRTVEDGLSSQLALVFRARGANPFTDFAPDTFNVHPQSCTKSRLI